MIVLPCGSMVPGKNVRWEPRRFELLLRVCIYFPVRLPRSDSGTPWRRLAALMLSRKAVLSALRAARATLGWPSILSFSNNYLIYFERFFVICLITRSRSCSHPYSLVDRLSNFSACTIPYCIPTLSVVSIKFPTQVLVHYS